MSYISTVLFMFFNLVHTLLLWLVFSRCFLKKRRFRKWYPLLYIGIFILTSLTFFIPVPPFVNTALQFCFIAIPVFFYEGHFYKKIVIPLYVLMFGVFSEITVALCLDFLMQSRLVGPLSPEVYNLLGFCTSKVVHYLLLLFIPLVLPREREIGSPTTHRIVVLIIPPSTYVVFFHFFILSAQTDDIPVTTVLALFIFLFLNICNLVMLSRISNDYGASVATRLSKKQYDFYSSSYEQAAGNDQKLMELRHEVKNILLGIRLELQEGNVQGVYQSLDGALGYIETETKTGPSHSGNVILDCIVNYKAREARGRGVDFHAAVAVPKDLALNPGDLAAIIGNLVDNGVEACLKNDPGSRSVDLSVTLRQSQLCITVTNPFGGDLWTDREGTVISTKDSSRHRRGIGLRLVDQIATRYGGFTHILTDNNQFSIMVVLNLTGVEHIHTIDKTEVGKHAEAPGKVR